MTRLLMLIYGAASYVMFLLTVLWTIAWTADVSVLGLPTIDHSTLVPWGEAIAIDGALLTVFFLHHSVFARIGVKRWFAAVLPAPIERSTYVLVASALLLLLLAQWRPMAEQVWHAVGASALLLWAMQVLGWLIVLVSTFTISHLELFGLKQVWQHWRGQPDASLGFFVRGLYRLVRHPLMLGFVIAFWATPHMSVGHLLFAGSTTAWILIALQFEEHELRVAFGDRYANYQRDVPMLVPGAKVLSKKTLRRTRG